MCGPSVPASGLQNSKFSYGNIYNAYLDCRKKKRNTFNALKYEINAEENNLKLERDLKSRAYHPSRSLLFAAKKPKVREIFAADFRDRVVHHLLVKELEQIYEPVFIYDSYACRDNKGTHAAVKRLQKFQRQVTKNGHVSAWFLQLDIKDFFTSINKDRLFSMIRRKVKNPDILWLTERILFWDCTKSYAARGDKQLLFDIPPNKSLFGKNNERGLPIGNLTSQYFANIYLDKLDQYIKHTLKAKRYIRYVDDFVLLSRREGELAEWQFKIERFLRDKLLLSLHPKRRQLLPISNGIDFLGYIVRPRYILVRNRVVNNLRHRMINSNGRADSFLTSYLGHFKLANAYNLSKSVLRFLPYYDTDRKWPGGGRGGRGMAAPIKTQEELCYKK